MNKTEFLVLLRDKLKLSGLSQEETADRLIFYGEMIDDRVEDGLSEEEAIAEIGSVDEIASQIMKEAPVHRAEKREEKPEISLPEWNTETVDINDGFSNIEISSNIHDISLIPADDGACRAVFRDNDRHKHTVEVYEGTLHINMTDSEKWYHRIAFFSDENAKLELHLPRGDYSLLHIKNVTGDIDIPEGLAFEKTDISVNTGDIDFASSVSGQLSLRSVTGDISVKEITAGDIRISTAAGDVEVSSSVCNGELEVSVKSGDIKLDEIACRNVSVNGVSGDVDFTDVIAREKISAEFISGDIDLDRCDAAELYLKTVTGDVSGVMLTDKVFVAESRMGDVRVPHVNSGGICRISTKMGDIRMKIRNS